MAIHISKNGNRIRATGADANGFMIALATDEALLEMERTKFGSETFQRMVKEALAARGLGAHEHSCHCGTASHTPHETGTDGCVRSIVATPKPAPNHPEHGFQMWEVDGHVITDFTLRQQRGYYQHPCGCWSSHGDSVNSIEA